MPLPFTIFRFMVLTWIGIAVIVFFILLRIRAPYGRHTTTVWGPLVDNHLGWMIMESPALAIMLYVLICCFSNDVIVGIMAGLFCLHYINRSFIFPFRLRTRGKKIPWVIVLSAIFFNSVNTFFLSMNFIWFSNYPDRYMTDLRFIIGVILFFSGMAINWWADNKLIHLRKPGETGYKIPQGGLFNYISCPNLFGELVEWSGFAILCWNISTLGFLVWTIANLLPRALAHHHWYREKFSDYPSRRKAILPFVV